MKRKIGSLSADKPRMAFVNGELRLFAVNASACYASAGSVQIVDGAAVSKPGFDIKFENHLWSTRDPDKAMVMIEEETNFEREWGFFVEEECIPEGVLRELFGPLSVDGKYVICFRLAEGKGDVAAIVNELKTLGLLGEDGTAPERPAPEPEVKPIVLSCPACGKQIDSAVVPNAQAAMRNHVRSEHPDFKGDQAEITG